MVSVQIDSPQTIITLRPNCSSSWVQIYGLLAILCATTLAWGALWAIAGAWLILPFSIVETLLASVLIYYSTARSRYRQIIVFRNDCIFISGQQTQTTATKFQQPKSQLLVESAAPHTEERFLSINNDQGIRVSLGDFLTTADKDRVISLFTSQGVSIRHRRLTFHTM